MRDLTPKEDSALNNQLCPFCDNGAFYEGPSGGMSVNIKCTNEQCGAEFCFHGGMFTNQLIREPLTQETKTTKIEQPYDPTLLEFLEPKKSMASKIEAMLIQLANYIRK